MGDAATGMWKTLILVLFVAAAMSAGLILILRPAFARYAIARPNARSSHTVPTPQGGGIAVVTATLIAGWLGAALANTGVSTFEWLALSASAILLALTGGIDDIRGLGAVPRLLIQIVAVGLVIAALPDDFAVMPQLAQPVERALLLLGGVFEEPVSQLEGVLQFSGVVPGEARLKNCEQHHDNQRHQQFHADEVGPGCARIMRQVTVTQVLICRPRLMSHAQTDR